MIAARRRTSWVRAGRTHHTRRRPVVLLVAAAALFATVTTLGVVGIGAGAANALAVCDSAGAHCVEATATSPTTLALVPLRGAKHDRVLLKNAGVTGVTEVGVVEYLTSAHPSRAQVIHATASPDVNVTIAPGKSRAIRFAGVPPRARAVLIQLGGTAAKRRFERSRAACSASAATQKVRKGTTCTTARVTFSTRHDRITKAQLIAALREWSKRTASPMPTATVVNDLAGQVGAGAAVPAHLAATIAVGPGTGAVTLQWRLDAGSEQVTAVRITRDGYDESGAATVDRSPASGQYTFTRLTAARLYTFTVAPVIGGTAGTPVTLTATPTSLLDPTPSPTPSIEPSAAADLPSASPSASVTPTESSSPLPFATPSTSSTPYSTPSASPSALPTETSTPTSSPTSTPTSSPSSSPSTGSSDSPSGQSVGATPDGWRLQYVQDFTKNAPLGTFADTYPGWATYDGNTDTSRETARPRGEVGLWNSDTTSSVQNGQYDCHLWTKGVQPQICALTPTPNGQPGQLYGRYSVRFKADPVPGYKIAWLLWPGSDDWSQGEIDFPEGALDGTITGATHEIGNPEDSAYYFDTGIGMQQWQTATIEWRPGRITFVLDDQSWTTTDPKGLPSNPMRWALQAESQIESQPPDPSAAGDILVDWVAGYSWVG